MLCPPLYGRVVPTTDIVSCQSDKEAPAQGEEKSAGAGCEIEIVDYFGTATNRAPVNLPSEPTMGA